MDTLCCRGARKEKEDKKLIFHEWIPVTEGHWKRYAISKEAVRTFYARRLVRVFLPFLLAKLFQVCESRLGRAGKLLLKVFGLFGMISLELYCVQEYVGRQNPEKLCIKVHKKREEISRN